MRFENTTGLPAELFRTVFGHTRICASCAIRVTYDWRGERLTLCTEQPWILSRSPWKGPEGPMPPDELFYRGGVDLFVFGSAWSRTGKPVTRASVAVRCGSFSHELDVVGDRVWTRAGGRLVASDPAPFVSMPLGLERAYGGRRPWDGVHVSYPDNPDGRGFYLDENDALGGPLPNIEDPAVPIRNWNDQVAPVGMGVTPEMFGPRMRSSLVFDEGGRLRELKPSWFNHAFPGMVVPRVRETDRVELQGVDPSGPVAFIVPAAPIAVELRIGANVLKRVPSCDQIGISAEKRRVFISYRYPFRYFLHPREQRTCKVVFRDLTSAVE